MGPLIVPLTKKELLEELLNHSKVQVNINPQYSGVDIPFEYYKEKALVLNLSYRFDHKPVITEWGVEAKLTFDGELYNCKLPWNCIFLIQSFDRSIPYLSINDAPNSLVAQAEKMPDEVVDKKEDIPPVKKSPFSVIKGGKS